MSPIKVVGAVIGAVGPALELVFRALDQPKSARLIAALSPLIQRSYAKALGELDADDFGHMDPLEVFAETQEELDRALTRRIAELRLQK